MNSLSKVLLFVFYLIAAGLLVFICSHVIVKFGHRFGWFQIPGSKEDRKRQQGKKAKSEVGNKSDAA